MELILIAAVAANGVIGSNNAVPWQMPGEQMRFKETTWGHCLLMGRRTWDSIGRALPGRHSIVVTRNTAFQPDDCEVVHSLAEGIKAARSRLETKLFVIGGEQLYGMALSLADTLILTRLEQAFVGDAFFPPFSSPPFQLMKTEQINGPIPYQIETWRRRSA
ncbi:MAG: dihydrofolate reductase [Candidatus Electronema aureum]|uniref:Dihydrofolate reductase n=1 Tax=Candidatus Electronema aureum TaxID=2005002 RepID=A0A521G131_9BACT|nr:MAG: dihydrofolate reductase [Candidatus Electronema aureum]